MDRGIDGQAMCGLQLKDIKKILGFDVDVGFE